VKEKAESSKLVGQDVRKASDVQPVYSGKGASYIPASISIRNNGFDITLKIQEIQFGQGRVISKLTQGDR
jgi:hypothetical protein